ncbi:MAG TPA: acyl-CoA dehydrogenase [Streptosporangiaceae bacterium]|nr:acyl-CoA dehydrogenase [Streptosporangiaceae bacterium]
MPIAITDEQIALAASIREWAKRAATVEAVRGQEHDAAANDAERWAALADLGVFAIGLPEEAGGAGGTATDLGAALAELARALVPGPVLPTLLAGRLLAGCADQPVARAHLPRLAAGEISVAVALGPGDLTVRPRHDGGLLLTGQTGLVLGAGSSTHLLAGATIRTETRGVPPTPALQPAADGGNATAWFLVAADQPGITVMPRRPADFSRSLADVRAQDALVAPDQVLAGVTAGIVRDLACALFSIEAAAVAGWCTRTAAEYAAVRHQFGRPIGSFQAVKHLCAEMLCRAETASVLAWDAARAIDDGPAELSLIAAAAAAHALDAGVANARDCIQVLGGIGFTWEHDAHLYLRRALSLRQLLGGTANLRISAARLAQAGARRQLRLTDADPATDELTAIRQAARATAESVRRLPAAQQRRALADSGYAAPAWPAPYGLDASPAARFIIDDELAAAGIARPDIGIGGWAIPAILGHGSKAQRERFAGPTLRGEISWCQLFSEPEAGSDLASLRTRAERVTGEGEAGRGWLLTGQKIWTSLAREADWAICLARTDSSAARHRGISYFLVAMDSPGIEIRPLREMTGRQMFNQVFLDQVFVPDDCVVGEPGDGWRVTRTTLASERVAMGAGSPVGDAVEDLLALATRLGAADDPVTLDRLGGLVSDGMAVALLDLQAVLAQLRGAEAGSLAAVRKLVGVRHRQDVAEAALELAGPAGAADDRDAAALLHEFLLTRCLSIAGGTTQILLSMVAERLLGLPREEAR